ncbi:putative malate dehydrogenase 1B isoform X2 [Centropristis striata]|uniref:putative malate dehydrogenase 1B isoform X2 n=1 Tax=Centropristis striata TaxID=184440 RepID=UPI0027DEF109|nr:putative malate dehydrogenase 1B isoform X2 [Centropristis striata]
MAKFVLAGKADCPYYAKAELLADKLQGSLPDFRIRKICLMPDEWEDWLENTCKRNGWKHLESPLIWRELVVQGGKGMLLGGFSDFMKHCQDYYGVTSDMPWDEMMSIAAENLEAKMKLVEEERQRASLITPTFHIWITGALNPTCHFLIPNVTAEVFPHISAISLHLLDLEGTEEELKGLKMEMEDLALPLLHQVSIHTDMKEAFGGAEVIVMLDESWSDAEEEEKKKKVKRVSDRYREYGQLIDTLAKKEVKVIVSGDSLVNLRCSLLLDNAPSIDSHQFVTMATQLENEAKAIIAKQLKVKTSDVTDVVVWGNISGSFYVDLQRAKVFNFEGTIIGPDWFSLPVQNFLNKKWIEKAFQDLVQRQRAAVASKTCRAAAMTTANGILSVLKAWSGLCGPDEVFSLGVLCKGEYHLPVKF